MDRDTHDASGRTTADGLTLRPFATHDECEACVALQRLTWGEEFREVVSPALLEITQRTGGIAAGAFDAGGRMVGFVYGLAGIEGGRPIHWSHMLAVLPELRDRGIGRALKEYQREVLRARGVERVYWTFDPLVARNAHLNLGRLGARVVEYVPDMYGDTGSGLHRGLGTDRLVVCWTMEGAGPVPAAGGDWEAVPLANGARAGEGGRVRIAVPADIHEVLAADAGAAAALRSTTRDAFCRHLESGWRVVGFVRAGEAGGGHYLLAAGGPERED